jgi:DNA-binding Lrp family transcriptional regulator
MPPDTPALGQIDQQIVALLREDARRSFRDIGERVSLTAPAVKRRVDRLAPSAILHVRAADTQHLEQALERIRDVPGVLRTQTQVVLSTLFERPASDGKLMPQNTGAAGNGAGGELG